MPKRSRRDGQGPTETTITFGDWAEARGYDRDRRAYDADSVIAAMPRVNFDAPAGRKVA